MDVEKMIERLEAWNEQHLSVVCGNGHFACDYLCENEDCIVVRAATALSTLQAENEKLKDQLYDGEGVNLVNYWMQQAKIEENGHRNCQAENEKLRAELEQVKRERDSAILFAQCYTEKVENPCTVCRHRFSEAGVPLKKRCENCGLTGTPECGWEFDFDWDLKSEED